MNILMSRFEGFPYGSAPAFRAFTMAKLLVKAGNKVIVVTPNINCSEDEIDEYGYLTIAEGIRVISTEKYGKSYERTVETVINEEQINIFMRPTSIKHYYRLRNVIKKYDLPTIMDSVEWYDPSNWRLQKLDPRYYYFQYLWKYEFKKCDGIIAISRLIEKYYKNKLDNVVRIPTITDCYNMEYKTSIDVSNIKFIFAGQLDKGKDMLSNFILALDCLDLRGKNIYLDIYGPNEEDVIEQIEDGKKLLEKYSKYIHVHGRVSQKKVQKACKESDFSVFFRQNRRSANAGFPTKLGECMTLGTPAFCNDTGDISLVIKNGINGYMVDSDGIDVLYTRILEIYNMDIHEREKMRESARKTAEEFFDYRNYVCEIQELLESIK